MKPKTEATPMIDKAVEHCIDDIAICQQNIKALGEINWRVSDRNRAIRCADPDNWRAAHDYLWGELHRQLAEAWNRLAFFAPISPRAMNLLGERTRTWFAMGQDGGVKGGIMDFLGYSGSYYAEDEDAFRAEVLRMFGVKPHKESAHE